MNRLFMWKKIGPAKRVILPSKKSDPAWRVTFLAKTTFSSYMYIQFAKFCKEMYENLAAPGYLGQAT